MNHATADVGPKRPRRALSWLWAALFHGVGVAFVATLGALLLLPWATWKSVAAVHLTIPEVMGNSAYAIALHIGLAACFWALLCILYLLWQRPRTPLVHALGARGSTMVETLIVLPVFFLFSLGMGQLAINNVAGILANVAVFQAARTAWVWTPEQGVERVTSSVSKRDVRDRARVSAAMVMTPAAPGNFRTIIYLPTQPFLAARLALATGTGDPQAMALAVLPGVLPDEAPLTMSRALDESSFAERGVYKFAHAYAATSIKVTRPNRFSLFEPTRIGVKLTYELHQAMPIIQGIFGKKKTVGGREGYYVKYTREFSFMAQIYAPNADLPNNSFLGLSGITDMVTGPIQLIQSIPEFAF